MKSGVVCPWRKIHKPKSCLTSCEEGKTSLVSGVSFILSVQYIEDKYKVWLASDINFLYAEYVDGWDGAPAVYVRFSGMLSTNDML